MMLAADPSSRTGQALLLRQMLNTVRALHQAQVATSQAREAHQVAGMVRSKLALVANGLPAVPELPSQPASGRRTVPEVEAGSGRDTRRSSPSPTRATVRPLISKAAHGKPLGLQYDLRHRLVELAGSVASSQEHGVRNNPVVTSA